MTKKKTQKRISKSGGVVVESWREDSSPTDYRSFIDQTRTILDDVNKEIIIRMFENAAILTKRAKTAMATFNCTLNQVVKDIAESPVGNRRLAPNTIYQYIRAHEFLINLKNEKKDLYKRLLVNAEKGLTRFNHIVAVSRSSADMSDKIDVLEKHVDGREQYISKRALEINLENVNDLKSGNHNNFWKEEHIVKNFLDQCIDDKTEVYAPFGTEGESSRIITPEANIQQKIVDLGLIDGKTRPIKDNSKKAILLHFPQHNLIYRTNSRAGQKRYKNFPVNCWEDFINRVEYIIDESHRVLESDGVIGVVAWNTEWQKELYDFEHEVKQMLNQKFQWVNTAVITMPAMMRNWFPRQAYRSIHIFKKL